MKGKLWKIGIFLFAVLILLSACAGNTQGTAAEENNTSTALNDKLSQLESDLQALRQKEKEYVAQIATLQEKVTQLSGTSTSDPLTEHVTFHYREENGGAVITGYEGNASILAIPATLSGLPVVAIGERAFEKKSFTALTLPEGVTRIDWFAFYECQSLADITLPSSLRSIGYAVFDGCDTLTIRCPADSYAEQYAQSYAIPYTNT